MDLTLDILCLDSHDPGLALPDYATPGAAGMDLRACLAPGDRALGLTLPPLGRAAVPTGLGFAIPDGYEGQVRPRSGLARAQGITVLNAPGTIDSDYRGEVHILLINLGPDPARIGHGERIAQLVIAPVARARPRRVAALAATARGGGGFGSTGRT